MLLVITMCIVSILMVLFLAFTPSAYATLPEDVDLTSCPVVRVVDGDTIVVELDGSNCKVRLIGIDTPETVHPTKPVEELGVAASDYVKELLDGATVYLEFDVQATDRYGRTLAYIWLEDGTMLNDQLLELGYAAVSTWPPNVKYVDQFLETQRAYWASLEDYIEP